MNNDTTEPTFSDYGVYTINEYLELSLPNTNIYIKQIKTNIFSYFRKDSEGNVAEKIIPVKSNEIQIELAPIRPLNHPARRSKYVFLEFDKDVHLSEDSSADVFVKCPIEIGIFFINGSNRESLDWVTCNPLNSRFGLYGPPDTGTLCKHAKVSLATNYNNSTSYMDGVMKIHIENTLKTGQNINKVIFPITDNHMFYEGNKTIIDGIKVTLKKRAVVSIADVKIDSVSTDWAKSPTWEDTTISGTLEMGLE